MEEKAMSEQMDINEIPKATPEEVWAMIRESKKEADREMGELRRIIGRLGGRFGEMVEHMVVPNIQEKFNALGYHFEYTAQNPVISEDGRPIAEVDILMENDECSIAVEVKSKPVIKDITDHIKRLKVLRNYKDKHNDKRKIHGAIAGAIMVNGVRDFALKKGVYVIEQSGDTVQITVPEGFKPGEW
jgi:predicted AAA+ superfamily ATPase